MLVRLAFFLLRSNWQVGRGRMSKYPSKFQRFFGKGPAQVAISLFAIWIGHAASVTPVSAAEAVMSRGDAAVTQFSGAKTDADVPKKVHPLDVTLIDQDGVSLNIYDLSNLGTPGTGEIADVEARLSFKARDIGQVFGVALDSLTSDQPPNIYVGASSLYGLQIVGDRDGDTIRLAKGEPGAQWMPGQWGKERGGGPGTIWKIDGTTKEISLFSNIISGDLENAGPGLGGIAFDALAQRLYVANLETGKIHMLDMAGREMALYDHGTNGRPNAGLDPVAWDGTGRMFLESPEFDVENPETWGYADKRRRVVALAAENDRLYYSVADGPVVWSVGLRVDGSFLEDARLEVDVTGTPNNNMITGIAFDGPETMYVTQRGDTAGSYEYTTFARPQKSSVLRYTWSQEDSAWVESPEEYAVGEEPVHRATNGGLALGYGYDSDGNIDYDKCRQTLWTTGEHLISGGERTVHGLQGQDKTNGQSMSGAGPRSGSTALQGDFREVRETELEPPEGAWYTASDEREGDEKAHGYVGSIATFAPCDGESISEGDRPLPEWPPVSPEPPEKIPGMYIQKECFPGLIGGVITCRISVTNIGLDPWSPVTISDTSTILAGPDAGQDVPIVGFTPDAPDWLCSPVPTTAFQCVLPAGIVLPGMTRFVDVQVDTAPLAAAGNGGFRNCAALLAPFGGIACAEGATGLSGLIINKTGDDACNPGDPCKFVMTISNGGTKTFTGDVQISDSMFVGGAGVAAPITATDLNCNGGNPAALPFTCVVPVSIAPGDTQDYSVVVTMPAAPPSYWAQNCFAAFDPGFAPPGGPFPSPGGPGGPGFGSPANPACHWVKAGNPPPQSNLIISKSNIGDTCDSSIGTGVASCEYEINIKNDGPSPFNNVITIDETTPPGSNLFLDPNWPCAGGPPVSTCTSPAAIPIAPGDTFTLKATIQIPALLTEPTCQVPNTVAITAPVGAPWNILGGDDTANATHNTALIATLNPDGTVSVACDPTNLKTEKKIVSCTDAPGSKTCTYNVTVRNMGPDPYTGPINIEDSFSAAPTSVTFSDGWNCSGGGADYLCTKDKVEFAAPDKPGLHSVTLEIKATIPTADQCTVQNTVHMSFPLAGTRFNQLGHDDTDSVSSPVNSPKCQEKPTCEAPGDGEFQSASGACVCQEGFTRERDGTCQPIDPVEPPDRETCPDGNPIPRSGKCPCEPGTTWNSETFTCEGEEQCVPGPNEYRTSSGQCVCKSGYRRRDGECVRIIVDPVPDPDRCIPGPNEYRSSKGNCYCKDGYERDDRGLCVPERELCIPGPNEYRSSRGYCYCRDGYERDSYGICVPIAEVCIPGPREYRTRDGWCACLPGFERDDLGRCVPVIVICIPGPNEKRTTFGRCVCKRGYERNRYGKCVPEWPQCPPRWHYFHGECVPDHDPEKECRKLGGEWYHGKCILPPDPIKECKKRGGKWKKGKCIFPPDPIEECEMKGGRWSHGKCIIEPDPIKECKKKGGTWNGRTCILPPDPKEECKNKGGKWKRGKCILPPDPAEQCKKKGGTWSGRTCILPPDPKEECKKKGGKWRKGKCVLPPSPAEQCKKKGGTWNGKTCVMPPSPKEECKKKGGKWRKGKCVLPPSPAEQCKKKGGTWNGRTCIMPPSPKEECKKKGGKWKNGKCITGPTPAEQCKKKGGKWNGKKCTFPPSPAEQCKKKGGKWKNGKCVTGPSPQQQCKQKGGKWKNGKCVTGPSPKQQCKQKGGKWKNGKCVTGPSPKQQCKQRGGKWKNGKCVTGPSPKQQCKQRGGKWKKGKCLTPS